MSGSAPRASQRLDAFFWGRHRPPGSCRFASAIPSHHLIFHPWTGCVMMICTSPRVLVQHVALLSALSRLHLMGLHASRVDVHVLVLDFPYHFTRSFWQRTDYGRGHAWPLCWKRVVLKLCLSLNYYYSVSYPFRQLRCRVLLFSYRRYLSQNLALPGYSCISCISMNMSTPNAIPPHPCLGKATCTDDW